MTAELSAADAEMISGVAVVIPTRNARSDWARLVTGLKQQGIPNAQILVIDSSSEDGTAELAAAAGFRVHMIERREFNHGGTRQQGVRLSPWARVVVFLTQDAVLADPNTIATLVRAFKDPKLGAAYGRQMPRPAAGAIERHARLFNYPEESHIRDLASRGVLGIKAAFLSNSFSAFRVEALCGVGGFQTDVIMAEDALAAGRLLKSGWKIAYVAEARVYHSHGFGVSEEFRRYFDTGVYHHREAWLLKEFGKPAGEGKRFVLSEVRYLAAHAPHLIPEALLRTAMKVIGYQLGLREERLGRRWARRFSLHKNFWGT